MNNNGSQLKPWPRVTLGSICAQDRQIVEAGSVDFASRLYLSLEHIEAGTGRLMRTPSAPMEDEGKSTTFQFDSRHVLYGKLRPYLNKVALPNFAGRCTTEIIPLKCNNGISRDFLAFLLRREETVAFAMKHKTGSRMPRADMDTLLTLEIPLPPLGEQERIAARLTEQLATVESARAAAQARLAAAEVLPAAYLREVFEGREASEWDHKLLYDICEGAGQYGTSQRSNGQKRGLPVLGMANIHEGRIRWEKVSFVDLSPDEGKKYLLQPGDLLFNRTNSAELVGKTAVFDGDRRAVFASYLIRFRVRKGIADPRFVASFINSRLGRAFIERHMGRAIGQVNISASTMAELEVPCPSLSVQQRLCDYIDRCAFVETGRLTSILREELADIDALPAALLREAFNGQT